MGNAPLSQHCVTQTFSLSKLILYPTRRTERCPNPLELFHMSICYADASRGGTVVSGGESCLHSKKKSYTIENIGQCDTLQGGFSLTFYAVSFLGLGMEDLHAGFFVTPVRRRFLFSCFCFPNFQSCEIDALLCFLIH